ncbi:MAG: polysaccharide biosynthesis C-terminal domain-containing protein [Bacteroidales bacterium]|jgi:O-antigen/teichoic acid export membrane protein|nr:polysaccharide biosynthesis C-terminal domain-containing protein [Bacteroidales bacterium]
MGNIKKLAGQTAVYGLCSMIPRFLNYLLVPLHTQVFPAAGYGVVTEWYTYVTFLLILLTYGLETGFFRFSQHTDKNLVYGTTFLSIVATSALFIVGITAFARPLSEWMNYADHREYLLWFGWILGLDALSAIPFARFRIDNRPLRFAFFKLTNVGVNILLNLFFLWFCPRYAHLEWVQTVYNEEIGVGYIFISNLIASGATILLLLPEIFRHKIRFDFGLWKRIIAYSLPLMAAGLAGNINEAIDRVLLKYRLPDCSLPMEQVGIYGANIKIAILMTLFIQMFRYAAEPFFFNNEKEKGSRQTIADVMKYFVIFCLIIFLGVTFYIDIIKHFLRSEEYWAGLDIVPVMLLANMCLGIYFNLSIWFKLSNQTRYGLLIAATGAGISIAGNWLLIPLWGYHASAWMHLICYVVMIVITWRLGKAHYPIPYDLKKIFLYVAIAVGFFFLATFTTLENVALNLLKNTVLLAVYIMYIERKEHLLKQILGK